VRFHSIATAFKDINLDKECVEGPVPYHFGNAHTKGTQRVEKAKQYQSPMTFPLTAVKKEAVKVEKPMKFVFGYVDGDSSDSSSSEDEEENANMNEQEY
jgi:replication-associated recombination protein RarA